VLTLGALTPVAVVAGAEVAGAFDAGDVEEDAANASGEMLTVAAGVETVKGAADLSETFVLTAGFDGATTGCVVTPEIDILLLKGWMFA
jgi:hypothetical protein